MKYTLNNIYVLRVDNDGSYYLYKKVDFKTHYISAKLYYILKYFLNQSVSFEFLNSEAKHYGIDLKDFYAFLENWNSDKLLIPVQSIHSYKEYNIPKGTLPTDVLESPKEIDFLITKHCNLSCKHCFEGAAPKIPVQDFSEAQINRFVEQLKSANIKTLKITGGEPFSHPNILQLLSLLVDANFETIILTNALLIDNSCIELLRKGHMQLGISMDGMTASSHDYIRGKGCFCKLKEKLQLISESKIPFTITCTINSKNIYEIENLIDFTLGTLAARSLFLGRLRPLGRASINHSLILSESQNEYVKNVYSKKKKIYGNKLFWADDSVEQVPDFTNVIRCSAGHSLLAIDDKFDVYPCVFGIGFGDFKISNLMRENLDKIWSSEKWQNFRGGTTLDQLSDCKDCKFKNACLMKNCRLRPVYEGNTFFDSVSYCNKHIKTAYED